MAIRYPKGMFRSARLQLTLFYMVILLIFSLLMTISIRVLAEREYNRSASAQLGEVKHMFIGFPWSDKDTEITINRPERALRTIQTEEAVMVRQHLNRDFTIISLFGLVVAGTLSYWFAGRTLKPIEEAHRSQARFASDASHELRTPLATMRVENEVFLRQKSFTQDEAREQVNSNLEEIQRLENLSSNLLALTHYGTITLAMAPISPQKLIDEAVERAQRVADARQVTFTKELGAGAVNGNYDSLVQLLGILIDNALKYGPQHGKVTIKGFKQSGEYVIQVLDTGPGIEQADLPHIFERLYRGDKARNTKAGGYGLGLALAAEIVKANHGSIQAANLKQGGACMTVRLQLLR
jgi:two-component system, OmpR family, sensor histidine kinase CiaH